MIRWLLEYANTVYVTPPPEKHMLRNDQIKRSRRLDQSDYRIYIKEEQQYNSVTKTIKDLGWKDQADRGRDTCPPIFYKIVNHDVNVPSEGIFIPTKGGVR